MFRFSYGTHSSLLPVTPIKLKFKGRSHTSKIEWHRIYMCIKKGRKGNLVKGYWIKARPKTIRASSKLYISMSNVKVFFRSPSPVFVGCKLHSLRLVQLPVIKSHWQVSHNSGFSNTLGLQ